MDSNLNAWKLWFCTTDQFTMSTCFCHQIQSVGTGLKFKEATSQFSTIKRLSLLQYLFIPLCFHILVEYLYKILIVVKLLIITLISVDLKCFRLRM